MLMTDLYLYISDSLVFKMFRGTLGAILQPPNPYDPKDDNMFQYLSFATLQTIFLC